jgi:thiamine monophosphate synthase
MRAATSLPLTGIGGITAATAGEVIRAGADGVAVAGAILAAPDPEAAAHAIRLAVDEALRERGRERP